MVHSPSIPPYELEISQMVYLLEARGSLLSDLGVAFQTDEESDRATDDV